MSLFTLWRLKNRFHAAMLLLASMVSLVHVFETHRIVDAFGRLLLLVFVHQHLMTLSHRLLFHRPPEIRWMSRPLTFVLKHWTVFFHPEGFDCVKAVHDTTQHSQHAGGQCLSEAMLWFSPRYLCIRQRDFLTASYVVKHTGAQLLLYASVFFLWSQLSADVRLWALLVLCVSPVAVRVLFYFGHAFLHTPNASPLFVKAQNHQTRAYDRQAYNLHLRGFGDISKYVMAFLYAGDHLHNNHHHAPNALCQAHGSRELDGAFVYVRALHRLRLLSMDANFRHASSPATNAASHRGDSRTSA